MARGPLPQPESRRRNQATIPTTALPAAGRTGPVPRVPPHTQLGKPGKAWWRWAWSTPQAAAWDAGSLQILARRAALEDDLATVADVETLDLLDALGDEDARRVNDLIRRLAALATGRLAILKEMRETDRLLGLTPKSLAELRWKIVEPETTPDLSVVSNLSRRSADEPKDDPRKLLA